MKSNLHVPSAVLLRFVTALVLAPACTQVFAQVPIRVGLLPTTEIPESVAVDAGGNGYLSIAEGIRKITPAGVVSLFAPYPAGAPAGRMTGMKFDAAGNLYAASGAGRIIWKFSPAGEPTRFVTIAEAMNTNDLVLDASGNMYVSDPAAHMIYKVDAAGNYRIWISDPLLKPRATPSFHPTQTAGCNGIALRQGAIYTIATQAGRIVRIPIDSNGNAGRAEVFVESESLVGGDGIAMDTNGDLYVACGSQNRIAVVKPDGRISTVATGGELSLPTAVAIGPAGAGRALYVCNNGHFYPGADDTRTGLVRIDIGTLADPTEVRLNNFAAQSSVGPNALVAGFTIVGTRSKAVVVRAIGPTLTQFGVTGALADPRLELYSGRTSIAANDNWSGMVGSVVLVSSLGAFPLAAGSRDAVIVTTLAPGSYTAQVTGVGNATGVALLEIYEVP